MAALVVLALGLAIAPEPTLRAFWYGAVPLLPVTFLLNTRLWRSVCPLATLNGWGNRLGRPRDLSPSATARLAVGGLVLFHLLVPARRLVFNTDGAALLVTITVVGGAAVALGTWFSVRSAFCNAMCPVLPIEQVYGQAPLLSMPRGRCPDCTVCTPRGCLDLAGGKALVQVVGPTRRTAAWLATPHGLFIAALPGFILGYSVLRDAPTASVTVVYGTTLGASAASVALIVALATLGRQPSSRLLPLVGGLSGMLYYWFTGPAVAEAFGAGAVIATLLRGLGMGVAAIWLWRAWPGRPLAARA